MNMEPKSAFFQIIINHYKEITKDDNIPTALLIEVCQNIADYFHEQYRRFSLEYPKSLKRYSTFQLKDLDHPYTFELIIKFFKNKVGSDYTKYVKSMLNMTQIELDKFEKSRGDFYNMF